MRPRLVVKLAIVACSLFAVPFVAIDGGEPADSRGRALAAGAAFKPGLGPGPGVAQHPDASAVITGSLRVIDGDTIDLGGVRIRLEGIDAPESAQTCAGPSNTTWPCGAEATRMLVKLVAAYGPISCAPRGKDVYGRTLATCFGRGVDLNAEMVRRGLAWAFVKYSTTYVAEERVARAARAGIWQTPTQTAAEFRATRWTAASESAPVGCAIKGNVSHAGRIYHMPWSAWYDKVVMRAEKGTRWFCSEAEAVAAGWRAARGP